METGIIQKEIENVRTVVKKVYDEYGKVIVGQSGMLERILIALFSSGHILLEGVPGLAKTEAVKTIASLCGLDFSRIQFTPDLLPADILGTQIFNMKTGLFTTKKGPLFSNIILADEINRAPSKVQSALLEAMQERQITIADTTYPLSEPYIVLATQNPIEQEGTYPLPEAQVDRFMFKVKVTYPSSADEIEIIKRKTSGENTNPAQVLTGDHIARMKKLVEKVYIDERLYGYIIELISATRNPDKYGLDKSLISYGASPRASIYLVKAAKAYALLQGDSYVKTEDIKAVAYDILRHRIILSYEAEAESITTEDILRKIFETVETP